MTLDTIVTTAITVHMEAKNKKSIKNYLAVLKNEKHTTWRGDLTILIIEASFNFLLGLGLSILDENTHLKD